MKPTPAPAARPQGAPPIATDYQQVTALRAALGDLLTEMDELVDTLNNFFHRERSWGSVRDEELPARAAARDLLARLDSPEGRLP